MLVLQGQCETVDNGTQDLKQLSDAVVAFGLVDEAVENRID